MNKTDSVKLSITFSDGDTVKGMYVVCSRRMLKYRHYIRRIVESVCPSRKFSEEDIDDIIATAR